MSSNMRVFYLYIISLITLIMFVSGIVATVYNFSRCIFPTDYVFFDSYTEHSKDYDEVARQNYKTEAIKDIIVSGLVIIIGFSLYKYHWKTIEKERNLINE